VNFVWTTSSVTRPVAAAPTPLITALRFHPGSRERSQCLTIPVCESVNAVKTPIT
jgi:hypothetical protein